MSKQVIKNVRIVLKDQIIQDHQILIEDGKIAAISKDNLESENCAVVNGEGLYLSPGFIDIHTHSDPLSAANLISNGSVFDVALIDITMPGMDGGDCFRALRKIAPGVKALLTSGHALDGTVQALLDEGMLGFIQKPYLAAQLSEAVSRALGR